MGDDKRSENLIRGILKEENYEELVGKEVKNLTNGKTLIVAGADFEVGITLHRKCDPSRKMCLINPEVIKCREKQAWGPREEMILVELMLAYKACFRHWIAGINLGYFTKDWFEKDNKIMFDHGVGEYHSDLPIACPFE
jgi:hypothetical protein